MAARDTKTSGLGETGMGKCLPKYGYMCFQIRENWVFENECQSLQPHKPQGLGAQEQGSSGTGGQAANFKINLFCGFKDTAWKWIYHFKKSWVYLPMTDSKG